MQQAILASAVGCTYIGCYIHDLEVHPEKSFSNNNKALCFPNLTQRVFQQNGYRTQVISASLTSVDEAMMLAGVHHMTVSPLVLWELARTSSHSWEGEVGSLVKDIPEELCRVGQAIREESSWRLAFTKDQEGENEARLNQAITFFRAKQDALEEIVRQNL
ncbi:hypothetical protein LTR54_017833 [Friedmanniomyces endolithicus]|nr:hypothetical protein LTS00_017665 [Friedmanniomyces endolithicus]KAK0971201.1 hypothetical protein LTR54_017833 [Friedmanniomyces endolithicus]